MNIVDLIPYGKENAVNREDLLNRCILHCIAYSDRGMRKQIEDARKNTVILNMQNGAGYFRPTKDDLPELRHYIAQEHDRSMAILHNLKMAKNVLEDMEADRL